MDRVTANDQLGSKLPLLQNKTAVYDQEGSAIGIYYPIIEKPEFDSVNASYSDDELEAFEGEEGGLSEEEVLQNLANLKHRQ